MLPRRPVSSCAVRRFPAAFSRATVDLARLDLRCCIAAALKGSGKLLRAALLHLLHLPSTPRCCASLDASNMAAMPTGLAPACRARAAEHSQAGCPATGSMIRAKCCATFNLLSRGPMRVATQPVRVGPTEGLPPRRDLLHDEIHDRHTARCTTSCTTPYAPLPRAPPYVYSCNRLSCAGPCGASRVARLRTAPVRYVGS